MARIKNAQVVFAKIPKGYPVPGETVIYDGSGTIDLDKVPPGGFLIKTLVLSIDPYMRGRMRDSNVMSYTPAFKLGEPLDGFGVGVVIKSENPHVKKGDHIYGPQFPFKEYFILDKPDETRILENKEGLPWSVYLGAAGMPGMTAFMGWKEHSKTKKGGTAFVTAGGGPVGSMVIQLAKQDGLKVISSAGSEEKIEYMKECGADVTFNYKAAGSTEKALKKEGPIDIYWDNVGGATLDLALKYANKNCRFIECGMISGYNQTAKPIENISCVLTKSLTMTGFIVFDLQHAYEEEFYRVIPPKLAKNELKHKEDVTVGLEKAGEVLLAVQKGLNEGKAVIKVADE